MILARPQNKMQIFVMPAWMAGIQIRKDASGETMSTWRPVFSTEQSFCK
jgi:hypothetical protein